jgi:CP family cyanate transporter-like MFS transporter
MSSKLKQSYRWAMLSMAWMIYFCFGLICFSIAPLITDIMSELNLTYTQLGAIGSAWPLAFMFSSYPEGTIIDRLGVKKSLTFGIFFISMSSALRILAQDFYSLILPTAMFGFGAPMISLGLPKLVATWFSGRERGTAAGIYYTGVSSGTAFSLGATNSIVLPLVGTWRNCFLIYGLIGFIVMLVWIRFAKNFPNKHFTQILTNQKTWKNMTELLKYRNVWLIVIIGLSTFFTIHSLNNWLPKILETKELSLTLAGFLAAIFNIFRIVGGLSIPRMTYSLGSRRSSVSFMLLTIALSILAIGKTTGVLLIFGIMAVGICLGSLTPVLLTLLMDAPEVGHNRMGAAGGLYFSFGEVGGILGPFMIGYLKDITGLFIPGLILLAIIAICMMIISALVKEVKI